MLKSAMFPKQFIACRDIGEERKALSETTSKIGLRTSSLSSNDVTTGSTGMHNAEPYRSMITHWHAPEVC